jgi:protein gp37
MFPCYAYRLANGRLKSRYLANTNIAPPDLEKERTKLESFETIGKVAFDPFYPRFWIHRAREEFGSCYAGAELKGIFVCDMGDLFGIGVPEEWTRRILNKISMSYYREHRFYLLTKQAQNLIKFSPFPDNCWVGVTATNWLMFSDALGHLAIIEAKVKYLSFEPLLEEVKLDMLQQMLFSKVIQWVIIGAQTKPKKLPEWEWVREIIDACDKAGIPVFLKDNLGLPRLSADGSPPLYKRSIGTWELRQEMPK